MKTFSKEVRCMKSFKRLFFCGIAILSMLTACSSQAIEKGYKGYNTQHGKNTEKVMKMFGSWTKTGIGTHYHSGQDAGPLVIFGLEGLAQYVRTTDEIVYLLAESITHEGNVTTVKIRDNAKWHDGYAVESMDFLSYYYLNHNETSGYMNKMEVIDNKTFKIYWKEYLEPSDEAKTLLLAQDTKSASVPYHLFKEYADKAIELTNSLETCPVTSPSRNQSYFDKYWTGEAATAYGEIYANFRAHSVDGVYPATGPFKLNFVNETQMILEKNKDYYFANNVGFEKIIVSYQPSEELMFQKIISNDIYYMDGTPRAVKLQSIMKQNGSIVHYKILDQGSIGVLFNLEKTIWSEPKVREAMQYIFDRDVIKNVANPYAETTWVSMTSMVDYEAEKYLNPDDFDLIKKYSFDQEKATALLQEAGWQKVGGKWLDKDNNTIKLTLGFVAGDPYTPIAEAVQSTLNDFGFDITLKSTESPTTLLANARITDSTYDFMLYFTALNPWGSHPGGAFKHMYSQMDAAMMHFPVDEATGKYNIILNKADGSGTFNAFETYEKIYTYKGNTLNVKTADLVVGLAEQNYGITFYNNCTGSFFNADYIGNLPLSDKFEVDRDITTIYKYTDPEFNLLANLNIFFTQASSYATGKIVARV